MSDQAEHVLAQALSLSEQERAAIAARLFASVEGEDEEVSGDWEAEWAAEAHRRAEEIRSGTVKTIPWEEVRAELRRNAGLED